ncbi:MAG: MFS transporter, partial [Chloroflexi bacterium]|nr:MFS transporter [Chloroflexota bacterium]
MAPVGIVSRGKVYHGWYIVAISAIAGASSGVVVSIFGLFFDPMHESLGWSRTAVSLALTIMILTGMTLSPVYGPIVDRKHGAMVLMVGGGVVLGVTLVLTSQVTQLWQFYLLIGVAYGMASPAIGPQIVTPTVIAKWFIRMRGRATAIVSLGHNVGAVIFIPLTAFIILNFGWRYAWFVLGIVGFILVVPLSALFVRRTPEDVGLLPDGRKPNVGPG